MRSVARRMASIQVSAPSTAATTVGASPADGGCAVPSETSDGVRPILPLVVERLVRVLQVEVVGQPAQRLGVPKKQVAPGLERAANARDHGLRVAHGVKYMSTFLKNTMS